MRIFAVFFTFFVDSLGWAIVFPIFAPYFLDPNNLPNLSDSTRVTVLGLFLTAFSLGQFIGAPILGEMADRYGRRSALLVSVAFSTLGVALTAWSMQEDQLLLLFAGRLLNGFFAGNLTICLACLADLKRREKAHYFGYLSSAGGVSFILGAFLGGKLSDPSLSPYFFPALPMWIAVVLSCLNFLFLWFGFHETYVPKRTKFDLLRSLHNLKEILEMKRIRFIYLIYFLYLFAWTILLQFTPVLMVQKYSFSNATIGDLALFVGVCWALGSSLLNRILSIFFSSTRKLEICLLGFTLLIGFIFLPKTIYSTLSILAGCVIFAGLAWPLCNTFLSNSVSVESQGKTFGLMQSVQSFAMTLAPILGGVTSQFFIGFFFLLGAFASLIAVVIYFLLKDMKTL